jgi:hypothetical protein
MIPRGGAGYQTLRKYPIILIDLAITLIALGASGGLTDGCLEALPLLQQDSEVRSMPAVNRDQR